MSKRRDRTQRELFSGGLGIIQLLVALAAFGVQYVHGVPLSANIIFLALTILAAAVIYRYVLRPWDQNQRARTVRSAGVALVLTAILNFVVVAGLMVLNPPDLGVWTFAWMGLWFVIIAFGIGVARADVEVGEESGRWSVVAFRAATSTVGMVALTLAGGNVGLAIRERGDPNLAISLSIEAVFVLGIGLAALQSRRRPIVLSFAALGLVLAGISVGPIRDGLLATPQNISSVLFGIAIAALALSCLGISAAAIAGSGFFFGVGLFAAGVTAALVGETSRGMGIVEAFALLYTIAAVFVCAAGVVVIVAADGTEWRTPLTWRSGGTIAWMVVWGLVAAGSLFGAFGMANIGWLNLSILLTMCAIGGVLVAVVPARAVLPRLV